MTQTAEILERIAEVKKMAIAIHNEEDGKNDIANAEGIVWACEKLEEIVEYGPKCGHCGDYCGHEHKPLCVECYDKYGPHPEPEAEDGA